ncbi:MAG: hypothetical protein AB1540_12855 [Bdellovibrionota bacterium]
MKRLNGCLGLGIFFLILFSSTLTYATPSQSFASKAKACAALLTYNAKRIVDLPFRLARIHRLIEEEFQHTNLNRNLRAFWGFHQRPDVTDYQMRPWNKVPIRDIHPDQVVGMSVEDMVKILQTAMEIEDPIYRYQEQSGKAFDIVEGPDGPTSFLPNLARFMGRNVPQTKYAEKLEKQDSCGSAWCSEEHRHAMAWARMIEKYTGKKPDRSNAAVPTITVTTLDGAQRHLNHRAGTEWGASSAYYIIATHTEGPSHEFAMNVIRDEMKHLTVVSAADVYLNGHVPNSRNWRIFEKTWIEFKEGQKARTGGAATFKNPFNLIEAIAAHVMIEIKMRRYLRTLPLSTLRDIFEAPSKAEILPTEDLSAEALAAHERALNNGVARREQLAKWPKKQREWALEQREFEERNAELINRVIEKEFNSFTGLENNEEATHQALERISFMDLRNHIGASAAARDITLLRSALTDRVVDYRIFRDGLSERELEAGVSNALSSEQAP